MTVAVRTMNMRLMMRAMRTMCMCMPAYGSRSVH